MSRYFDFREWDFDEICHNLRERIAESKKPIPPKVMVHSVCIVFRQSESSYTYTHSLSYSWGYNSNYQNFKTREEAEKYIATCAWIEKLGDNFYIDIDEKRTYTDKNGKEVLYHYEIKESDYEQYADGNSYYEYSDEEKRLLSETLYNIEKARAYISAYDYCCDQCSFGEGRYEREVKEELKKFEKEYTEELPPDEDYDD